MAQQREVRMIKEGLFGVTNTKSNNNMTNKELLKGAKSEDPALLKNVSGVLKKLPSQQSFWNDVKRKVEQMIYEFGPATFWSTFSPREYDDENLHKYLHSMNADLPGVESMTTSQLVCQDPVLAGLYIQNKFNALLDYILSDAEPLGKVTHFFVRTEYQTRQMPHWHCLFWCQDAPVIGVDSDEVVLEYIGKYISCKLPSANDDPILHDLVKRYQTHYCNSYCSVSYTHLTLPTIYSV